MLEILTAVLKGGFKTSEFWVTIAGLLVAATGPLVQGWVDSLHAQQAGSQGATAIALAAAAAILSGTYTIARSLTKAKAANAAAIVESAPDTPAAPAPNTTAVLLPSGNVMTPGPGAPALEEAHRAAIVAATEALSRATAALEQASSLPRPATFGAALSTAASDPAPQSSTSGIAAPVASSSSSSSSGASPGSQ